MHNKDGNRRKHLQCLKLASDLSSRAQQGSNPNTATADSKMSNNLQKRELKGKQECKQMLESANNERNAN